MFSIIKNILYVDADQFEAMANFYQKGLGIPAVYCDPANLGWAEFDTGSTRLCFHGNPHYKTDLSGDHMKYNHIVLCAGDIETVSGLREKFVQNGYAEKELYDVERGEVSVLVEHEAYVVFWVSDPMGNMIQVESVQ